MPGRRCPNRTTDATRLLSGWHQDREFVGPDGKPLDLAPNGAAASFENLARRYAPGVPASAMLKELRRVAAVTDLPDGRLRATRRYYQPTPLDPQWILNAGSVVADLELNINHNLAARDADPTWFLGRATDSGVDARAVPEFRAFLEDQGQQFLVRVDEWLTRHRLAPADHAAAKPVRLGVGLFMIKDDPDKESGQ